jgi:hypothetical protein
MNDGGNYGKGRALALPQASARVVSSTLRVGLKHPRNYPIKTVYHIRLLAHLKV